MGVVTVENICGAMKENDLRQTAQTENELVNRPLGLFEARTVQKNGEILGAYAGL